MGCDNWKYMWFYTCFRFIFWRNISWRMPKIAFPRHWISKFSGGARPHSVALRQRCEPPRALASQHISWRDRYTSDFSGVSWSYVNSLMLNAKVEMRHKSHLWTTVKLQWQLLKRDPARWIWNRLRRWLCNRRNTRPIRVGLQTSFKTRKHLFIHNNEFDWK